MKSLRLRLLALTSLFLVISFAALGGVIDRSFVAALEQAQRDLLDSQIITLLAVAEPEGDSLVLPPDMPEVRLNSPGSGLYANISRADGTVLWRQPLPAYRNPNRRRVAIPHYGPLLAGGRLIVASGDGVLRSFDPATGTPLGDLGLPGAVTAQPAIAGATLYVVTEDGSLHALR